MEEEEEEPCKFSSHGNTGSALIICIILKYLRVTVLGQGYIILMLLL